MKFISIDSSLRNTGVAIGEILPGKEVKVEKVILHTTEKSKNKQVRASSDAIATCRSNYAFVKRMLDEHQPDFVFAETPSGSQSSSGMKSYGATCQLIAAIYPEPIEVTPMEVKVASFGTKTASKKDMIDWAYNKFPDLDWFFHGGKLQNKNEHIADAIAIVYAAINTNDFNRVFNIINK